MRRVVPSRAPLPAPARASRLRLLALTLCASLGLPGCGIVEANFQAVETLASDSAPEEQKTLAALVIGGTLTLLTGLGVAATLTSVKMAGSAPAPPEYEVVDELGWGLTRAGGEVRWFRCTSRLLCTHEEIVEREHAILAVEPAGNGRPIAMGGAVGDEVALVALRIRRRR